jgi:fructokinase
MVVCVGEALVDFLPGEVGGRVRDTETWIRCSGGSPANVAVGVARLGGCAAMLGVVGEDEFGHYLVQALRAEGVDVHRMRQTREGKTGLVFVSVDAAGQRSFAFHRTRSAEYLLRPSDVDVAWLGEARVVHVGTNSLLMPEAQQAVTAGFAAARAAGRVITMDPNLRLHAWPDPSVLRGVLERLIPQVDVLKLAEDEFPWVTGEGDVSAALRHLEARGVTVPVITLGPAGAAFRFRGEEHRLPAPLVAVVDTTGAGDGFMAGLLAGISRTFESVDALRASTPDWWRTWVGFGCQVGSRVCERLGAVTGLPRAGEIQLPG